jgi:hypothetical protein
MEKVEDEICQECGKVMNVKAQMIDAIATAIANARAIRARRMPRPDVLVHLSARELGEVLDDAEAATEAVNAIMKKRAAN